MTGRDEELIDLVKMPAGPLDNVCNSISLNVDEI